MTLIYAALFLLQTPPAGGGSDVKPRATTLDDARIELLPSLNFRRHDRDGAINEAVRNLNTGMIGPAGNGDPGGDNGFSGRVTLRADALLRQDVRLVLELENRTIDNGNEITWGRDNAQVAFEQAYLRIDRFVKEPLTIQAGAFDLSYRLRPHDEPFLLDIHESESAFTLTDGGSAIRTSVERDTLETAGVKARWETLAWAVDLFNVTVVERGSPAADESLSGIFAEVRPREYLSVFLLLTLNDGAAKGARVWTAGGGVDYHVKEYLELFGETYVNFGALRNDGSASPSKISKRGAYGGEGGARLTFGKAWIETAYAYRTGDEDPGDGDDNAFQSYENEDRFLIVQDDEFGLDLDTNIQSLAVGAGVDGIALGKEGARRLNLRGDLGIFELDQDLVTPAGFVYFRQGGNDVGKEIDLSAELEYNRNIVFYLKGALLIGSDLLEGLTQAGDDRASIWLVGLRAGF